MKINSSGIIYKAYENDGVNFPERQHRRHRGPARLPVLDRPGRVRPAGLVRAVPAVHRHPERGPSGARRWPSRLSTATYSVSVGIPYAHVKWFRGRETSDRSASRCPDPACCTLPPAELAARWADASWPSARVHSALLASLPAGAFPGVDQTEVMEFLDRQ